MHHASDNGTPGHTTPGPIARTILLLAALGVLGGCERSPTDPTPAAPAALIVPIAISQVSAGGSPFVDAFESHACAIAADDALACWGNNDKGQATPPAGTFKQVSAGGPYTCAINSDDELACWGDDLDLPGLPPAGTFNDMDAGEFAFCAIRADQTLVCIGEIDHAPVGEFTQVSTGGSLAVGPGSFACAIAADDTLACWGRNDEGQATPPAGTFKQISAGGSHACAIDSSDALVCWGDNNEIQAAPQPGTFNQVSAGRIHTCAIRTDDTLLCWGTGAGNPPTTGTFKQVSAGSSYSCAIRSNDTAVCWGDIVNPAEPPTEHVLPTANFTAPGSVDEGSAIQLSLADAEVPGHPDATDFTYAFDCGDGAGYGGFTPTSTADCPTSDDEDSPRTVRGRVQDQDGDTQEYTADVVVANAAPVVDAGADQTIDSGDTFALGGSFSDAGLNDGPWAWTVDWGAGQGSTSDAASVQGAIAASKSYLSAGTYTVVLSVTDKDGGEGSDQLTLTVRPLGEVLELDIMPGDDPNTIKLQQAGKRRIPVALLSTAAMDAPALVDVATITLGDESGAGTPVARRNNGTAMAAVEDVNGDGRDDLVIFFELAALIDNGDLTAATTELVLLADLLDGRQVRAADAVHVTE